jgi:hypothetical protein
MVASGLWEKPFMAFKIKNPAVLAETVSLRIAPDGTVDRWLLVETYALPEEAAMASLIGDANALLKNGSEFAGVEIRSRTTNG